MRAAALVTLVLCLSQPAFAQLAATPNAKGVAFGHLVLDPWGTAIDMTENLAPDKPGTH